MNVVNPFCGKVSEVNDRQYVRISNQFWTASAQKSEMETGKSEMAQTVRKTLQKDGSTERFAGRSVKLNEYGVCKQDLPKLQEPKLYGFAWRFFKSVQIQMYELQQIL